MFPYLQTQNHHFVTIYDGKNEQATLIGKLSGILENFSISSSGNYLFVKFEISIVYEASDTSGFLATIHYGNLYLNNK